MQFRRAWEEATAVGLKGKERDERVLKHMRWRSQPDRSKIRRWLKESGRDNSLETACQAANKDVVLSQEIKEWQSADLGH